MVTLKAMLVVIWVVVERLMRVFGLGKYMMRDQIVGLGSW